MAGSNGKGIRAGKAFVELSADNSKLQQGLKAAQAKLRQFSAATAATGAAFVGAGLKMAAGAAAIIAPIVGAAKAFSDQGDALDKMAARTGMSVEALSELAFAAERSGATIEDLETAVRNMQRQQTGDAEANLLAMAERLKAIEDPSARAALAMETFGKSGTKLLPMLLDDMEALRAEAKRLGLVMSTVESKQAASLNDALGDMQSVLKRVYISIGSAVAPVMQNLALRIANVGAITAQWVKANKAAIVAVAAVGAGLGAAAVAAMGLGVALKGLALATTAVTVSLGVMGGAVTFLTTPLGLVTAAVGVAGVAWLKWSETGQRATAAVGAALKTFGADMKATWGGISAALQAGDLPAAAAVATAGIRLEFAKLKVALAGIWQKIGGTAAGAWKAAKLVAIDFGISVIAVMQELEAAIGRVIDTVKRLRTDTFNAISDIAGSGLMKYSGIGLAKQGIDMVTDSLGIDRVTGGSGAKGLVDPAATKTDSLLGPAMKRLENLRTSEGFAPVQTQDARDQALLDAEQAAADAATRLDQALQAARQSLASHNEALAVSAENMRSEAAAGVDAAARKMTVRGAFGADAGRLGGSNPNKVMEQRLEELVKLAKEQVRRLAPSLSIVE